MGYVKLLSPNLISTIVLLDTNLPKLEKKIDSFRDLLVSRELTKHSETTVQEKEFAFKVQFSNDYMGVSTFVNKTKLLFEVESFTLGAYNVDQVENENYPHLQQLVQFTVSYLFLRFVFQFLREVYLLDCPICLTSILV